MNPALLAAFVARFGPWFQRMVSASPSLLTKVVTSLKAADKKAIIDGTVGSVIKYAKANPATAALTMTSLASLGFSISDLFGGDEEVAKLQVKLDPESSGFLRSLAAADASLAFSPSTYALTVKAADESATMKIGLAARRDELDAAREVLSFAKKFFGSPLAALQAHRLLQSFMEMPHEDVQEGFSSLKIN